MDGNLLSLKILNLHLTRTSSNTKMEDNAILRNKYRIKADLSGIFTVVHTKVSKLKRPCEEVK